MDGGLEPVQLNRFDQMFGEAGVQTFFDVSAHAETTDGDSAQPGNGPQTSHQLDAGAVGQCDIADEQVELVSTRCFHGRAHVMTGGDEVPPPHEQSLQRQAGILVIVD